jgi:predicted ATPase
MIRLIEALNFRCLKYVSQPLERFQVLVGPNASGKTTFLDVVGFIGHLVSKGIAFAVEQRTSNFADLVWQRRDEPVELAIELAIPEERRPQLSEPRFDTIRYEVRLRIDESKQVGIDAERVLLKQWQDKEPRQRPLFPMQDTPPTSLMSPKGGAGTKTILSKASQGNDNFYSEVAKEGTGGWIPSFRLGPFKSALGNLPEDETRFPVTTWLKQLLTEGVQSIVLNSLLMRLASPPGQKRRFRSDGGNLPWVISEFRDKHVDRFHNWITHLRTALPDFEDVRVVEREDDKHRYLMICYHGGLAVPSWMSSDGTLRLMALTLPAYLPGFNGVFLVEEPENGIHPRAVETLFQSLSSVYDAQVLLASHSPVILSIAEPHQVLCFKKTEDGATDIVAGSEHPALRSWKRETTLGELFAAGVLG